MPRRAPDALRPLEITPHFLQHAEGSALVTWGNTRVLCAASLEERLPGWLVGKGKGWVTAEYDMLPRATHTRRERDSHKGRVQGRTQEISRLIGRALRSAVDLDALGERSLVVDCDVLEADGGTRTAAITGGYVALALALRELGRRAPYKREPLRHAVMAVSVGLLGNEAYLDLDYQLDANADVDFNVVMTDQGALVEVQGCAEGAVFARHQLDQLLDLALGSVPALKQAQDRALAAGTAGTAGTPATAGTLGMPGTPATAPGSPTGSA